MLVFHVLFAISPWVVKGELKLETLLRA